VSYKEVDPRVYENTPRPAWVYACPKNDSGIHTWRERQDGTAICTQCMLELNAEDTASCFGRV